MLFATGIKEMKEIVHKSCLCGTHLKFIYREVRFICNVHFLYQIAFEMLHSATFQNNLTIEQ